MGLPGAAAFFSSFLGSAFFSSAGLNSVTFLMKSSGFAANLPAQPFQQNPIVWPL